MATKRSKRIDPNDAFNTIVGIQPKDENPPEESAKTPEKPMGEGRAPAEVIAPPAEAPAPTGPPSAGPDAAKGHTPVAATTLAPQEVAQAELMEADETTEPEEKDAKSTKKLVQKGYYLTEEQVRKLGIAAVMQGVDRSFIVRSALELYFQAHEEAML